MLISLKQLIKIINIQKTYLIIIKYKILMDYLKIKINLNIKK